ncbi:tape measure protein [Agrobacterium salinitolerans]|uniref:tape measure protein n=1 Tax=Agrobacterium salinitolerans TaxID=1183413 RepID=UPI0022B8105C|nr:tape measure protein [Agrobacterium salinitolerans]MCZ7855051.1 tape measure protein [Agrobacterium salinitolerans]
MATDLERLVVQLSADVKGYQNALNRAMSVTNRQARSIENRFRKMNSAISASYAGVATGAAKAFALIGGAQGFRQLSDSATKIDNSLKVAGLSGEELEGVYQKLFAAAQKNAAPLETLVQLYGRVSLVQGELGVSSEQIVSLSNNVALALRASGQSSQEASGALLQLSQALGSGVVRAEEFNSILEGAPTILQAAAAGIQQAEGSVAKLRQIMLDGKLSSKAFFDGINAGAPVLEQKVAGAVLTLDQRLENLRTALTNATRDFNKSSNAANTFGSAIDNMASFINSVDMDGLASDIGAIIKLLNEGATAAQNMAEWIGRISGLQNIGAGVVDALGGKDGKVSYLGGALTIESTVKSADKLNDITAKRLDLEKQIAEIKANPMNVLGQAEVRQLEGQIKGLQEQAAKLAPTAVQTALEKTKIEYPSTAPTIGSGGTGKKFTPIDITDPQYQVTSSGGGGKGGRSGRTRADEYAREVEQITKRTAALKAETEAQAGLNPLLNDYGYTLEFARAKQDLLTAAQEAGVKITPELTASIDDLAAGYANAVAASEKLAEKQDEIRQRAEEAMATAKDVTRGIIDGFVEGASAADILADSLKKIGNALLDDVLNSIFKVNNAAGGGGGFLSGLLGLFGGGKGSFPSAPGGLYSEGGYTGDGGKYQPAGVVHKGEYVFDKAAVKAAGGPAALEAMRRNLKGYANGGPVGISVPSVPSLRSMSAQSAGVVVNFNPVVDNRGASVEAVARQEKALAKMQGELQSRVEAAVRSANKRNVKLR